MSIYTLLQLMFRPNQSPFPTPWPSTRIPFASVFSIRFQPSFYYLFSYFFRFRDSQAQSHTHTQAHNIRLSSLNSPLALLCFVLQEANGRERLGVDGCIGRSRERRRNGSLGSVNRGDRWAGALRVRLVLLVQIRYALGLASRGCV